MPDDLNKTDDVTTESAPPDGAELSVESLKKEFDSLREQLAQVNQESAGRRHKIKELEDEREALKRAQMERLEQEGNYKALAEERAKKLAELETYQERATALEATIRDANDARIQSLPEHMRGLVPVDYAPEKLARWLDENQSVLVRPTAPNLGAGVAGGNGQPIQLTAQQKQIAGAMGMTEDEYATAMKKMGK